MHQIKTVSRITGVNVDTIRSWERRYDLLQPARDEGGRRLYSQSDIDRLNLIATLVKDGHAISLLAGMETPALEQMVRELASDRTPAAAGDNVLANISDAIKAGDDEQFRRGISSALLNLPPPFAAEYVLAPALHKIGNAWASGEIDVGLEHLFSSILREQLNATIATLRLAGRGPAIAFTTLSGERHEIGTLIACYIAASSGFRCAYLGPDLPPQDMIRGVHRAKAKALAIGSVTGAGHDDEAEQIAEVKEGIGEDVELWLGVGAHSRFSALPEPEGVRIFRDYESFNLHLDRFRRKTDQYQ
ncbi:MAG: MerR family transcriptional regulator [Stappiaceae bacterium]